MNVQLQKGNQKTINAWAFYDWANSAYPLVINTAIFPIYYNAVTTVDGNEYVDFLGYTFHNGALYSYTLSFSFLMVSILSPLLSGIADYSGNKKRFLQFFCYFGALCCFGLYWFSLSHLAIGLLCVVGASIGYWGSVVFYNAYLPEIAEPHDHDRVSAKGYALGYFGSALLLIVNLAFITKPDLIFDVEGYAKTLLDAQVHQTMADAMAASEGHYIGQATRNAFLTVAAWWVLFAQITFKRLPNNVFNRHPKGNRFVKGYRELKKVAAELRFNPALKMYLLAFFVFSMGVQTVLLMATIFAEKEINMSTSELITTILIIQFVAIAGSYLFSYSSSKMGNVPTLMFAMVIWLGVCVAAYFVTQANGFYAIAAVVGLIMGGVQALSRSTYSKLLPDTIDHASYFSFYDVAEKVGIVIGTFSYGAIIELTGGMRMSIIALGIYFIVGFALLFFIPKNTSSKLVFKPA